MRFVIQRVMHSKVTINGEVRGQIGKGFMVLIGVGEEDTVEIADKMIHKMVNMRIFEDENGKTNLGLKEVGGSLLLISQFTLYADCKRGNRPSFIRAGAPDMAENLYKYIIARCKEHIDIVEQGEFGADMKVELVNDGPFTVILVDSPLMMCQASVPFTISSGISGTLNRNIFLSSSDIKRRKTQKEKTRGKNSQYQEYFCGTVSGFLQKASSSRPFPQSPFPDLPFIQAAVPGCFCIAWTHPAFCHLPCR